MLVPSVLQIDSDFVKIVLGLCIIIGFIIPNNYMCDKLSESSKILKFIEHTSWIISFSYMYYRFGIFTSLL